MRETPRAARLRRLYGMTVSDYDMMLGYQGGRCAGCRRRPTGRRLDVDHCHATREVRGLLCHACNRALGLIRGDRSEMYAILKRLAIYVKSYTTGLYAPQKRRRRKK